MAEIVKIKVSSLTEAVSLDNLVVLGVDGANNSVKVPILLLKGNKGDDGADGTEIELQKTATHLQWRYVGGSWVDLVALADLKGDKGDTGANIELQKSATHLQWRVSGTDTWNDLVALADLKGAKGDTGEGFIIKGYYNTLSALQLAVTNPNAGDAYGVGNTAPFDIYVYDSVSSAWVNNGALQGPAGASSYTYIAYASNDQGADFSLTDGAYIAIKTTTTPIANPQASDFAGLWKHYKITAAEVAAGIEIGGRNYIKNSEIKTLTGWNPYNSTLSIVDDSLRIVSNNAAALGFYTTYVYPLNAQRQITISFYAKNNKENTTIDIYGWPNGNGGIYFGSVQASSVWVKLSCTFYPHAYQLDKVNTNSIYVYVYGTGDTDFQIKQFKAEYGNKATDWTPAPEDFATVTNLTNNRVAKSDGTKLVNSAIREVGGKVAFGNDSPLANFDFVGTSVSRGDVYTYRDVASKYLGAGIQTGAVVITLPRRDVGTMFQITIKGYNNTNATVNWEVTFGGYWLYTTNEWNIRKVEIKGVNPFGNQVRVGYSGSLPVLVLGDTNTQFNFASVSVNEVIVSYTHMTLWGTGWTITQVTDLTGYTLVTPTTHVYYHSGNFNPSDKENAFSKNTAFNKNFGTTAGTVAEGDHTHNLLTFLTSQSTVTTLASLPVTKRVIVATVTAATTLSLAAALEVGRELHIKVYNASGSAITQPLPTSSPFESKKVDGTNISSISIPAGGSVEISILSVTDKYIIKTDA